jgi:hypothetical protein
MVGRRDASKTRELVIGHWRLAIVYWQIINLIFSQKSGFDGFKDVGNSKGTPVIELCWASGKLRFEDCNEVAADGAGRCRGIATSGPKRSRI